jgi:hypothetical protein
VGPLPAQFTGTKPASAALLAGCTGAAERQKTVYKRPTPQCGPFQDPSFVHKRRFGVWSRFPRKPIKNHEKASKSIKNHENPSKVNAKL